MPAAPAAVEVNRRDRRKSSCYQCAGGAASNAAGCAPYVGYGSRAKGDVDRRDLVRHMTWPGLIESLGANDLSES